MCMLCTWHFQGLVNCCTQVIDAGGCVTRIAKKLNNPDLCEKAYIPERNAWGEDRGSCFGYFAGKEKDYGYCERLLYLSQVPEAEHKACISYYIGRDESKINQSLCDQIPNIELRDFCTARVRNSLQPTNLRSPLIHTCITLAYMRDSWHT